MAKPVEFGASMGAIATSSASHFTPGERLQFLADAVMVEKAAWPPELQAPAAKFQSRLELFPEGFFVVKDETGKVLGFTTSQIATYPSSAKTWDELTDNGFIRGTHNPSGNALYVVSVGVGPEAQGKGVGSKLVAAQKQLATQLGLSYLFLGARIPGYDAYCREHGDIAIEDYLELKTEKGERLDPEIRFYERNGLHLAEVKPDFEPDEPSRDFGAVMVWDVKHADTA